MITSASKQLTAVVSKSVRPIWNCVWVPQVARLMRSSRLWWTHVAGTENRLFLKTSANCDYSVFTPANRFWSLYHELCHVFCFSCSLAEKRITTAISHLGQHQINLTTELRNLIKTTHIWTSARPRAALALSRSPSLKTHVTKARVRVSVRDCIIGLYNVTSSRTLPHSSAGTPVSLTPLSADGLSQ